jgi:acetyl esterase/lipase
MGIVQSDIQYGTAATQNGTMDLFLDIYQPSATCSANRPMIVFVHGGGFVGGNKAGSNVTQMAEAANARDITFVSIQYRLEGDQPVLTAPFEAVRDDLVAFTGGVSGSLATAIGAAFEDTVSALNFLESNRDLYCLDTNRLAYWGSSAGAFTVLQVAYGLNQFGIARPEPLVVVDYWGNLLRDSDLELGEAPFFVLHGTADPTVAYQDALDLTAQADVVGVDYALYSVLGAGHGFGATGTFSTEIGGKTLIELTIDFVEDHIVSGTPTYGRVDVP